MTNEERFKRIFRGREDAHGRYVPAAGEGGKKRVSTLKKPVPAEFWTSHLAGVGPFLGIVPIRKDNHCYFGAIDLDDDAADHAALEAQVRELKLPLTVVRSKSGGAHLYVFFDEPVPAKLVINKLKLWVHALKLKNPPDAKGRVPSVEVFPKQASTSEKNLGNWINLPYYNAANTNRYAVVGGRPLAFEEFLDHAEASAISAAALEAWHADVSLSDDAFFGDGPPCLQTLHDLGLAEGERNQGLYNIGIYLKLKYPDDWADRLFAYNEERVDPPLPDDEIQTIVRSLEAREYVYKCNDAPIVDHCQRSRCKRMTYGIDAFRRREVEASIPEMRGLKKIMTDPPRWLLTVAEREVELTTDDLMILQRFRRAVLEKTNIIVPLIKTHEWDKIMRELLDNVVEVEAPEDAGTWGQFYFLVMEFLKLRRKAESRESLLQGKPFAEDGRVYFRSHDLGGFLVRRGFRAYSTMSEIYSALRSVGAGHVQMRIKGQTFKAWYVPMPDEGEQDEPFTEATSNDPEF